MSEQWEHHMHRMALRDRGRPRTASDEIRARDYRDENGKYTLTSGLKPWHERVVDYMVLNPHANIKQCARAFQVSPQWMGMLQGSDAFKEYYRARMSEHQGYLSVAIVDKMQSVAVKALDRMADKIDNDQVPMGQLQEAASLTLKSLGYASGMNVNVVANQQNNYNVVSVSKEALEKSRQKLVEKARGPGQESVGNENHRYVTAALDVNAEDIEDAVILSANDE